MGCILPAPKCIDGTDLGAIFHILGGISFIFPVVELIRSIKRWFVKKRKQRIKQLWATDLPGRVGKRARVIPTLLAAAVSSGPYTDGMANIASPMPAGRTELIGPFPRAQETSVVPLAIIRNKEIRPGAKLVYSKLLDYASTNVTASTRRLAADLAVSPRSVRNYIAALKDAGLVKVRLHPGKPSSYQLIRAL